MTQTAFSQLEARAGVFAAILIAALSALLVFSAPANAQSGEQLSNAGTDAFEQGVTAYRAQDHQTARGHFQTACEANHARGCAVLGLLLRDGMGGATDGFGARDLFHKACNGGYAAACGHLGFMLRLGTVGVSRDLAGAREAYGKGCDAGDASACGNLGSMLLGGGFNADARARDAFRIACEADLPVWCREYGQMLTDGTGGAIDSLAGRAALQKACTIGDTEACFRVGNQP